MILLNGQVVPIAHYPNNELLLAEQLVQLATTPKDVQTLTVRYESDSDFFALYFIHEWLLEEGYAKQHAVFPYLPYSRMDRKVARHLFSLSYIAKMLNAMQFEKVIILEAHSSVSLELIERVEGISYTKELVAFAMEHMAFDIAQDAIVFPDKGARKRYASLLPENVRVLEGEKTRDFDTGEVLALTLIGDVTVPPRNVLIVDDLCSRGSTFIQVSDACRAIGSEKSYMAVTHLEHNVFNGHVFDEVTEIYTTDALQPFLAQGLHHSKIRILPLPSAWLMTPKR